MKGFDPSVMINIAVLISGTGRTLKNFHHLIQRGKMPGQIVSVISSKLGAPGAEWAAGNGLDVSYVTLPGSSGSFMMQSSRVFDVCREAKVDLVCMAGWVNFLSIPPDFKNRVMNIHPSLLPAFGGKGMYGMKVHEAVLEHGCKWTGVTVHFADDSYDTGPIIAQSVVKVEQTDTPETLADRVFKEESLLYPACVYAYAEGRLHIDGRRITMG